MAVSEIEVRLMFEIISLSQIISRDKNLVSVGIGGDVPLRRRHDQFSVMTVIAVEQGHIDVNVPSRGGQVKGSRSLDKSRDHALGCGYINIVASQRLPRMPELQG